MFFDSKPLKTYDDLLGEELLKAAYAKMTTDKGTIWLKLYPEEAPIAVANFAHLATGGFYNGLNFHRVIAGFMAQGGCPEGSGRGGPAWRIPCEATKNIHRHKRGTLSMAHAGRDTGGSQFFICFVDCPHLDKQHTVFGGIEAADQESFATLDAIRQGDKILSIEICETKE